MPQTKTLRGPEGQECASSLWRGSRALWTSRGPRSTLSPTYTLSALSPLFPSEVCAFWSQNQAPLPACLADCNALFLSDSHLPPPSLGCRTRFVACPRPDTSSQVGIMHRGRRKLGPPPPSSPQRVFLEGPIVLRFCVCLPRGVGRAARAAAAAGDAASWLLGPSKRVLPEAPPHRLRPHLRARLRFGGPGTFNSFTLSGLPQR